MNASIVAPKLLAALERMVAAFQKDKRSQLGAMVEARAAIAAAKEGEHDNPKRA